MSLQPLACFNRASLCVQPVFTRRLAILSPDEDACNVSGALSAQFQDDPATNNHDVTLSEDPKNLNNRPHPIDPTRQPAPARHWPPQSLWSRFIFIHRDVRQRATVPCTSMSRTRRRFLTATLVSPNRQTRVHSHTHHPVSKFCQRASNSRAQPRSARSGGTGRTVEIRERPLVARGRFNGVRVKDDG